jgi:hypothetical protein
MSRPLGDVNPFNLNFEIGKQAPIDARTVVAEKNELTTLPLAYPGMVVSVFNDTTASNNGVYFLDLTAPVANPSITDWKKLTVGDGITSIQNGSITYLSIDNTNPSSPILTIEGTETAELNRLVARDANGRAFAVNPPPGSNDNTLATTSWVNTQLSSTFNFKGGFNANTGDIDSGGVLYPDTDPARVAVSVGDTYVVTTSGDFFGNASTPLTIGDSVICQTAAGVGASQESNFIVIQSDTDLATANTVGLGNVKPEDFFVTGEDPGISVRYSNGTAFIQNTSMAKNANYFSAFYVQDNNTTITASGPDSLMKIFSGPGILVTGNSSQNIITIGIDFQEYGFVSSDNSGTINYMPIFAEPSKIVNSTLIYNPNQSRFVTTDGFQPGSLYLLPSDPGSQVPVSIYDKDGNTGEDGQVLTSDGSGVFWGDVASGNAYELAAQQVVLPGDVNNVLLTLNTGGQVDSQVTLIAGSNITLTRGTSVENEITIASTASGGGGSMSSFTIDSNNLNFQTVTNETDVYIIGGSGLSGKASTGPKIELSVDYSNLGIINDATDGTLETLEDSDLFLFQDNSGPTDTAVKKGTLKQLQEYIGGSGGGSIPYVLDTNNNFLVGHTTAPTGSSVFNTSLGKQALLSLTDGERNSALGYNAGQKIGKGSDNIAVGYNTLLNLTEGKNNIAIGNGAAATMELGEDVVAIGKDAGASIATNKNFFKSVYIGNSSGEAVTTGTSNTYVGHGSGSQTTTSDANVVIGAEAEISSSTSSGDEIVIGAGAVGHFKSIAVIGNTGIAGIHPGSNNLCDLGSPSFKFKDSYIGTLHSSISFNPPETNTSSGTPGDIVFGTPNVGDTNPNWYIYVCVQPNNWRRVELNESTWSQSNPGQTPRFVVKPCDTSALEFTMSKTDVFNGSTSTTIPQNQYSVGDFIVYKDDANGALKNGEITTTTLSNRVSANRIDISQTYPTNQDVSCT